MKTYVGCKVVQAELDKDEKGYVVVYPDGYTSWSPKSVFELAYREITNSETQLINSNN